MAEDIRVRYGSTGFEKIRSELSELEKHTGGASKWFHPMKKGASEAATEVETLFTKMSAGAKQTVGGLATLGTTVVGIAAGVAGLAAIVGGAGVAAFTSWTMSLLKTTEGFRKLEISLYGSLKSWEAVNKVSSFAKEYAAEYPAMYGDIMRAMQSLAFIPSLKPAIQKGDVEQMKEFMHVVQGLMVMRPEQGIAGSIWALREALAGNWRSLQMRFDVPISAIAKSAGMTMEEMKSNPETAMKAMKGWINEFVGADTMSMMAKNLGIQIGNLKDKYEIWIDTLGKSGVYEKVVGYILKLNDVFERFMKSDKVAKWTQELNTFLEGLADKIAGIFTKGIDWENISTLGGLGDALKQVAQNAADEFAKAWDAVKAPLGNALKNVFKFLGGAAASAFTEMLLPAIGSAMAGMEGMMKSYRLESPLKAAGIEAAGGAVIGGAIAGPKGALIGGIAGVALQGWAEMLGLVIDGGVSLAMSLEETAQAILGIGKKIWEPSDADKKVVEQGREALKNVKTWDTVWAEETRRRGLEVKQTPGEFMKWMKKPLWEPTSKREAEVMGAEWKEPTPWQPKAAGQLEYYGQFARMGGMMAGREEKPSEFDEYFAREKERMGVREKWVSGEISTEDWRKYQEQSDKVETKRGRMAAFGTEKEAMLVDILGKATEKKEYGIQSKVYGEMFNAAYQKGDFGKAQEFMNKSLESMLKQMEKEDKRAEGDSKNLGEINKKVEMLQGVIDAVTGLRGGLATGGEKSWGDQMREEVREGPSNE